MSNDIAVTSTEIHNCLGGILMQLKVTGIDKNHGSFAEAMEELNMWEFVFNQAEVSAVAYAYNRKLNNLLRQ